MSGRSYGGDLTLAALVAYPWAFAAGGDHRRGHQIVAALREPGRPVDYLELAGEGHEYRRAGSRRKLIGRMLGFLVGRLTVGPPLADPAARAAAVPGE